MTLETDLRDRLASAAGRADRWDDDWSAVDAVIERRRVEKRRRAVGGMAAAVVAAAVLVPTLAGGLGADGPAPAGGATPSSTPAPAATTTTPSAAVTSLPAGWRRATRGSLATDTSFTRAVAARAFSGVGTPTDQRVVFAGDVGGRRWAVVVGVLDGSLASDVLVGAPGAPADALTRAAGGSVEPAGVTSGEQVSGDGSTVLLLAQPGDRLFRAPALVGAPGERTEVGLDDGVTSIDLPRTAGLVQLQVERDGQEVGTEVGGFLAAGSVADPDVTALVGTRPLRGPGGVTSSSAISAALAAVVPSPGLTVEQVHPVVLWAGPVTATAQAVVLAMTTPSGQVVTSAAWGVPDGTPLPVTSPFQGRPCGTSVHPAGTSLADLVVVAECAVGDGIVTRKLVVSAPTTVTGVQLQGGGRPGAVQPLAGSGAVDDPGAISSVTVSGPRFGSVPVPVVVSNAPFSLDGD